LIRYDLIDQRACLKSFLVGNIIHIFSEKDSNFDVYTGVIDEKLGFFVAKIGVILVEREILDRLKPSIDKINK
jgi:hypothetical protein